jgi:DNA-binding Xre family transcriptional regulator
MTAMRIGYRWHLRRVMADRGMFATTALVSPLAERGVRLSREQVYRLVTGVPERLNLTVLATLCDILDCAVGDLIEPAARPAAVRQAPAVTAPEQVRPLRARITPGPRDQA